MNRGATLNYGAAALAEVLGLEAVGNPLPTSAEPVPSCSLLRRSANAPPNVLVGLAQSIISPKGIGHFPIAFSPQCENLC